MTNDLVLGLGGCVDFEIAWDAEVLAGLAQHYGIRRADLDLTVPVEDERSLVISVLSFLDADQGGERFIATSQLGIDFAERFRYKISLGGTCVRAGLAIAKLGVPSLVHLVSIDDNVRRLLPSQISYLCSATDDTLDPHVIVQFPGGAEVPLVDGVVRSTHPNRIILVNDPPNRDLALSPELPLRIGRGERVPPFRLQCDARPGAAARAADLLARRHAPPPGRRPGLLRGCGFPRRGDAPDRQP